MTKINNAVITFGKYKGQDFQEVIARDPSYVEWLKAQPWFNEKFPNLVQVVINQVAPAEQDTPEHNAMQALFLRRSAIHKIAELCAWAHAWDRYYAEWVIPNLDWIAKEKRIVPPEKFDPASMVADAVFEINAWDVLVHTKHAPNVYKVGGEFNHAAFIELKPTIGEDYPSILRTVTARDKRGYDSINTFVLFFDWNAQSVSYADAQKIFASRHVRLMQIPRPETRG